MPITVTDQASANAALAEAGADTSAGLAWYEANTTGAALAEIQAHHRLLNVIGTRGEVLAGVAAGTFVVRPDGGGGPKS